MLDIIQNSIRSQEMYLDSLYYRQSLTEDGIKSRFSNLKSIKIEIREVKQEIEILKKQQKKGPFNNIMAFIFGDFFL